MGEPARNYEAAVSLRRLMEPSSGLPIFWAEGELPELPFDRDDRVTLVFDGRVTFWHPLRAGKPTGSSFELLVLDEPGVRRVEVVLRRAGETPVLFERTFGISPPRPNRSRLLPNLAGRVLAKLRSGEAFEPRRWKVWSKRLAYRLLRTPRPIEPPSHSPRRDSRADERTAYDARIANNDMTPRLRAIYAEQSQGFRYRPKFSILMPVYNVDVRWLRAAVESVRDQVYDNWELCLADDASTRPDLLVYLRGLSSDPRIKVAFRPENGHICRATNTAADLASGEFVAFMDNDDALAPDALFHYARLLQDHPDADLIYSDEDKIDADDRRYDPQLKPDWSPEMFLSYNYVNHLTCLRRSLFESVGRFRPGYEGAQDYDLLLRAIERTQRIHHVPRVLYHWRALPSSTAAAAAVKPVMFRSVERGLTDYLARRGVPATIYHPLFAQRLRIPVYLLDFPDTGPSVAILIPVTDDRPLSAQQLSDLRERTTYRNYRIIVLDRTTNGVTAPGGCEVRRDPTATVPEFVNRLAGELSDEFLLLLDPSLEVAELRWLSRLVGYVGLSGVGCTGARIVGPDETVRHAGIVLNMYDETAPGRAFEGLPAEAVSYFFQAEVARPVAAIGGECLLTRRQTLLDVGGFDSQRFPGALAAVDYCRRLAARGLRSVYVAGAELRQHGPAADRDDPREVLSLRRNHGRERDAYFHPGLSHRFGYQIESGCPDEPELRPNERANVLFAAHNLNASEGAPRYLFDIAEGLVRRGRVRASVYSPFAGAGAGLYEAAGIPVHVGELPYGRKFHGAAWEPDEYDAAVDYAARMIAAKRPDVVVANTLCNFVLVEAAHRAGVPSVWIIHESYTPEQMRAMHSPYALTRCEAAFRLADRVLIASHDTARLFDRINRRNTIEVIHNGLEARAIEEYIRTTTRAEAAAVAGGPRDRKRITAIGTVCLRKSQHDLVQAAALLRRRGRQDFFVDLVGVRDSCNACLCYTNHIRAIMDREGLHDCIRLIPETGDVRPYLRAADVFVCASRVEAFSRSMLEAEAFGLPVVSTPCCGVNEQVVWGHNALRFEMGDSRQLADHLERLLADDALRQRMAECSRAVYDCHLTCEEMLERYERLILNVWLHAPERKIAAAARAA
ncbi:MAG TPA: glycosyltransferase [Gemmataceae bacterium]|nr:glycosyltransferase [Gemmataceae bacterium]